MKNDNTLIKKQNKFSTFDDLNKTVAFLSTDISIFLSEELEDLNVSSYIFRSGIERALTRILSSLIKKPQRIVIFPDSVPGFTLMIFRKIEIPINVVAPKINRDASIEIKESQLLYNVVSHFFNKNQQKVLIIENEDIIFALFPVADTRKNLKDLGLYISY